MSFVNDHTRLSQIFAIKKIMRVGLIFKNFNTVIQAQSSTNIQVLKTANAREYFNPKLGEFLSRDRFVLLLNKIGLQNGKKGIY